MNRSLALAFVAFFAFTGAAAAQTAEEAVAYAFLGLADGAKIERSGTKMSWVETSDSPASFDGNAVIGGHENAIRFIVKALEDCRYEITLEGPSNLVPGGSRLFGQVNLSDVGDFTIAKDGSKSAIEGIGFCETGQRNTTCMTIQSTDFFGTVDPERHRQAMAFLREQVCTVKN